MLNRIMRRLEEIEDLPTFPEIVTNLNRMIEDPNSTVGQVAGAIGDDPAITAKVLKLVNSAFYRRLNTETDVTSLPYAVARVGMREIRNVVLSMSVFNMFKTGWQTLDRREFWRHCLTVAITTRVFHDLSEGSIDHDEGAADAYYVAGLLHDVGLVVLEQHFHRDFVRLVARSVREKRPLHEIEEAELGINHGEIGAFLADRWNLPSRVVNAIGYHHHPEVAQAGSKVITYIVHLADFVTNKQEIASKPGPTIDGFSVQSLKDLGLPLKIMSDIFDVVAEEARKTDILLGLAA